MLIIDYQSEGFPPGGLVANGPGKLDTSWDDLLWSALTIGRPNLYCVFQHGDASFYEAFFRMSLVRMAVEQAGPGTYRLRRTPAAASLDPSEKGAVNYFLGMAICKLFAAKLLNAPWLLHFDVLRPGLNVQLKSRSRPDLIGQSQSAQWLALESKGRTSIPNAEAREKAKEQAERCQSVNGIALTYHIGGIMYFKREVLRFFWRDPQPERREPRNEFPVRFSDALWRHYYSPVLALIQRDSNRFGRAQETVVAVSIPEADVEVAVFPDVLKYLAHSQWAEAKQWSVDNSAQLRSDRFQPDGIRVLAGPSWNQPFGVIT